MRKLMTPEQQMQRELVKGGLAAAAPGLATLVVALAMNSVDLLQRFHLGFFGMLGLAAFFFGSAYLLRKARWWAGIPALIASAGAMIYFGMSFVRPLNAYLAYNQIKGIGGLLEPLMLLSPQLVLVLISLTLGLLVFRTIRMTRPMERLPVTKLAWGVLILWLVILGGDALYQNWFWPYMAGPQDLVIRTCVGSVEQQNLARQKLLSMGAKAAPALVKGLSAGGQAESATNDCMRQTSLRLLMSMRREALPALRAAAAAGDPQAAHALKKMTSPGGG